VKTHLFAKRDDEKHLSFKSKIVIYISKSLELMNMDLFGYVKTTIFLGTYFVLVMVDDYSRYIWIFFLTLNSQSF